MLETVLEFALDRLEASGEAEMMRERHANYFVGLAESAGLYLQWQRDTGASIRLLNADRDNLRAAVSWAFERGSLETFLRMAAAMQHYWVLTGRLPEGRGVARPCDCRMRGGIAPPTSRRPARGRLVRTASWLPRPSGGAR